MSQINNSERSVLTTQTEQTPNYGSVEQNGYGLPKAKLYTVVVCLYMCAYLASLDATVVSTLMTIIASDLNSLGDMSWIATAYLLSCSALQPIYGKLSDIFGRKVLLLGCCLFFGVGCGISTIASLPMVIIGRFITGIGGSGLTCLSTITLSDLIPPRDRGIYQGYMNVFFGLGTATGGIFGGFVNDIFGWQYAFGLQIPITMIVALAIQLNLKFPEGSPGLGYQGNIKDKLKHVDFLGLFFLVSSLLVILTIASLGGKSLAFNSKLFIVSCLVAVLLLVCFVLTEQNTSMPIIPIHLLKIRTVVASSLTNWFYTMCVFTYLFYIPVYYTSVMGFDGSAIGIRLIPNFLTTSIGSVGAGFYMKKTGKYLKLVYCAASLAILGMINIITVHPSMGIFRQFLLIVPSGLAYSVMLTVTLLALISAVPSKQQAGITSVLYTFRATGSTLGVALASSIFRNCLKTKLKSQIPKLIQDKNLAHKIITLATNSVQYVNEAPELVQGAIRQSYEMACKGAFTYAFGCVVIGVLTSLMMKENVLHKTINR